ncbi:MAG: NAD+ synthase [Myxococcales bacterium]|nr:NAD+ synthase [Myxococcales bacterium]
MRVALCQLNFTVGALDDNARALLAAATEAAGKGARLAIFPELALTGYPPRDLLDRPAFVDANLERLEALATAMPPELCALVGFVERSSAERPRLHNAVALIRGGRVEAVFRKRLLPTYDVFDEARYFTAGEQPAIFDLEGRRFGVTICEDAWNDADSPLRRPYPENPVAECVAAGAEVLINISGSPFTLAKREARAAMLEDIARGHGRVLLFANLVGANDDLIFDGNSAVYGPDGATWARAAAFEEQLLFFELEADAKAPVEAAPAEVASPAAAALGALTLGVRDYARKCGFRRAVLGLSGGIDSALTAAVAARALGPEQVLGVAMPTRYSSAGSIEDARDLAAALGIGFRVISIDGIFQRYLEQLGPELEALGPAPAVDTTYENIQARIRGNTLMAISNRLGHLLLTTGNKSEIAVGYCTLYGDMAGGLAVISDLPKTFVYGVAREFNRQAGRDVIPRSTLEKSPSAELRPDQKDEDSLPPYDLLDAVLERLVEGAQSVEQVVAAGYERAMVERIAAMVRGNEYKRRQMPPGLIITSKAFGPGRRMPIAQGFPG